MLYELELLQPISGSSATAIKKESVENIDGSNEKLFYSEELQCVIGMPPQGIRHINVSYAHGEGLNLSMGEFDISEMSVFTRRKS